MANDYPHLSDEGRDALNLSDAERIKRTQWLRDNAWVPYPVANEILRKIEEILDQEPSHRMDNLLIYADTNNGKSRLLRVAANKHPVKLNLEGDAILAPVVFIEVEGPDLDALYNKILRLLNAVFRERDRVEVKQYQLLKLFEKVGTRSLFIDEVSTAVAGPSDKQRKFFNTLKYLGNKGQISIVATGTREARNALRLVPQMNNRFIRRQLKLWSEDDEFMSLLSGFECILPLREPSNLDEDKLANKLYTMCEGYIGELSAILTNAAVKAIKAKTEKIDAKLLDKLNWIGPKERMNF